MTLDSKQLYAFLCVAECGTLGRAAAVANLTQPALSRLIQRLEITLRVKLFERHTTGMQLTVYGEALLPYAKLLKGEAELVINEINSLRGLHKGAVRVGAVASAATTLLPSVLERLLAKWPELRIEVLEGVEDRLSTALDKNEIDVAIAVRMTETEEIVRVADNEFRDKYMVIVSTQHPLRHRECVTLQDVLQEEWIMPPPDALPRQQFDELVRSLGATPPRITIETRSPSVIKAIVTRGRFLGWLPQPLYVAEQAAKLICALPVEGMQLERRFFVYCRRRTFVPPPVLAFLEELRCTAHSHA